MIGQSFRVAEIVSIDNELNVSFLVDSVTCPGTGGILYEFSLKEKDVTFEQFMIPNTTMLFLRRRSPKPNHLNHPQFFRIGSFTDVESLQRFADFFKIEITDRLIWLCIHKSESR